MPNEDPNANPWTRPIRVSDRGDLFEFGFNERGLLVHITCYPSGQSAHPISLDYEEVPREVRMDYENQFLARCVRRT